MLSNYESSEGVTLHHLNNVYNKIKQAKDESFTLKEYYIQKNKNNEQTSQWLGNLEEQLHYMKDMMHKEWIQVSLNSGKSRILLNHALDKFHAKNKTLKMQYQCLASVSMVEDVIQINKRLQSELFYLTELYESTITDYRNLYEAAERCFINKTVKLANLFISCEKII